MHQVSLKGMLEFTAGCGFFFALGSSRDLILYGIAFAVLTIWSLRASSWAMRWLLVNWLAACSSIFFGLACFEQALLRGEPGFQSLDFWLLGGCGLIVWTPLAGINGFLFLAQWMCWDTDGRAPHRVRKCEP